MRKCLKDGGRIRCGQHRIDDMEFCYYPGCTLKTKAKDLDTCARSAAQALGVTMTEVPDWQCCGAVYPMARDEIATRLASVRALRCAGERRQSLLTLCSACHHVIKRVNHDMHTDADIRAKVNNYMRPDTEYAGETRVVHYLEMLRDTVGFDELRKKVKAPLTGKKIAAYYGCLLLRPSAVMQLDDPENPTIMEDLIRSMGAQPVVYPYRNECCGGYITIENNAVAAEMCKNILDSAVEKGAEAIITACPLCLYNLKKNGKHALPVYYFTELLAQALEAGAVEGGTVRAG